MEEHTPRRPPLAPIVQSVRSALLTWFGVIGGAMTLFSGLKDLITVSDWAAAIIRHWNEWTRAFWTAVFGWIGLEIPPEWSPLFTFLVFLTAALFGAVRSQWASDRSEGRGGAWSEAPSIALRDALSVKTLSVWAGVLIVLVAASAALRSGGAGLRLPAPIEVLPLAAFALLITLAICFRDKMAILGGAAFLYIFYSALVAQPLLALRGGRIGDFLRADGELYERTVYAATISMVAAALVFALALTIVPARRLNHRFMFMLVGLGLLVALNAVSYSSVSERFREKAPGIEQDQTKQR